MLTNIICDIMASHVSINLLPLLCRLQAVDSTLNAILHVLSELNCSRHVRVSFHAQEFQWMLATDQHEWVLQPLV